MGRLGVVVGWAALGTAAACGGAVSGPTGGQTTDGGARAVPTVLSPAPQIPENPPIAQPPLPATSAPAPQPTTAFDGGCNCVVPEPPAPPAPTAPQPAVEAGVVAPVVPTVEAGVVAPTAPVGDPPATCRQGPLYYPSTGLPGVPNSIPNECLGTGPEPVQWSSSICSFLQSTGNTQECVDAGWGLTGQGALENPRSQGALPVLTNTSPVQLLSVQGLDTAWIHCHRGGMVGVTWDCGSVPVGAGGTLATGAYVLTEYVRFGGDSFPSLGAHIVQTLYVTASSLLLISDDDNNFCFDGTYTYVVQGNRIAFNALRESQPPFYRAFPASATFRATPTRLDLYDTTRLVRATYVRLES